MTGADLDPRVQALLDDVISEMDLDMEVATKLLERAQHLEGEELEDVIVSTLRSA